MKRLALILVMVLVATTASAQDFDFRNADATTLTKHVITNMTRFVYLERSQGTSTALLLDDASEMVGLVWKALDEKPYSEIIRTLENSDKFTASTLKYIKTITGYVFRAKADQHGTGRTEDQIRAGVVGMVASTCELYDSGYTLKDCYKLIDKWAKKEYKKDDLAAQDSGNKVAI